MQEELKEIPCPFYHTLCTGGAQNASGGKERVKGEYLHHLRLVTCFLFVGHELLELVLHRVEQGFYASKP
jgi:hypothetical protein